MKHIYHLRGLTTLFLLVVISHAAKSQSVSVKGPLYPVIGINAGLTSTPFGTGITHGADFSFIPQGIFIYGMFNRSSPVPTFMQQQAVVQKYVRFRNVGLQLGTSIHHKNFIWTIGTGFRYTDGFSLYSNQALYDYKSKGMNGIILPVTAQMFCTGERSGIRFSYTFMVKPGFIAHEGLISFVTWIGG